ncbi:hypothetical protein [Kitasatospora viridis]|uniref:Uncharacterized protein n=1 Tax=Kitasatospora viridis TaxID=281105 RepID=A0A561UDM3_9ACTN|nr:hypothetical protein [Kitasatospora viridis]TWF97472.1 hypothetical protein FHX73_111252 [Kitasatospora viridis]
MAATDRRPAAAWATVALVLSVAVTVPGLMIGGSATYLLAPEPFFWFLVVPIALLMLGLALLAGYALADDVSRRWFGWRRRRSTVTGLLLGLAGLTPWVVPDGPSVWRADQSPGWAAVWCGASLLALPAAALLLVPRTRVRAAGAIGLLLLTAVWGSARHAWLDAESRASYQALGSPPRPLLRLVDWDGNIPSFISYKDGRLSIEYDQPVPLPAPDGSQTATLVVEPLPPGGDADSLCAEGRTVSAEALSAARSNPDPSTACLPLDHGLTQVGTSTLARQDGDTLLFLVLDDDTIAAGNLPSLTRVLNSAHPATNPEIRDLAAG